MTAFVGHVGNLVDGGCDRCSDAPVLDVGIAQFRMVAAQLGSVDAWWVGWIEY